MVKRCPKRYRSDQGSFPVVRTHLIIVASPGQMSKEEITQAHRAGLLLPRKTVAARSRDPARGSFSTAPQIEVCSTGWQTCAHATRKTRDRLAVPLGVPLDHAILLVLDR